VTCRIDDDGLTIEAAVDGRDASLELYTAEERCGLLAETMGMPVRIVLTEDTLVPGGPGGPGVSRHPAGGGRVERT
jgi:hypothetical protein